MNFGAKNYFLKNDPIRGNSMRGNRLRAFPKLKNAFLSLIQGQCIEAKIKFFYFLIKNRSFGGKSNFWKKIEFLVKNRIFEKKNRFLEKNRIFGNQGSIFKLRECVHSISPASNCP
jgi:hypothetical protein